MWYPLVRFLFYREQKIRLLWYKHAAILSTALIFFTVIHLIHRFIKSYASYITQKLLQIQVSSASLACVIQVCYVLMVLEPFVRTSTLLVPDELAISTSTELSQYLITKWVLVFANGKIQHDSR